VLNGISGSCRTIFINSPLEAQNSLPASDIVTLRSSRYRRLLVCFPDTSSKHFSADVCLFLSVGSMLLCSACLFSSCRFSASLLLCFCLSILCLSVLYLSVLCLSVLCLSSLCFSVSAYLYSASLYSAYLSSASFFLLIGSLLLCSLFLYFSSLFDPNFLADIVRAKHYASFTSTFGQRSVR